MFYLGSDSHSRRVIEKAHEERAQVFASLWAALFARKTDQRAARGTRAAI